VIPDQGVDLLAEIIADPAPANKADDRLPPNLGMRFRPCKGDNNSNGGVGAIQCSPVDFDAIFSLRSEGHSRRQTGYVEGCPNLIRFLAQVDEIRMKQRQVIFLIFWI
jgi:hypothetical protein